MRGERAQVTTSAKTARDTVIHTSLREGAGLGRFCDFHCLCFTTAAAQREALSELLRPEDENHPSSICFCNFCFIAS